MNILGLAISHNSSACLMMNGAIVGLVQEERFTKEKNQVGLPLRAAESLIDDFLDGDKNKIDDIVIAGKKSNPFFIAIDRYSSKISIGNHIKEMHELWYPHYYQEKKNNGEYWMDMIDNNIQINHNHNFNFNFLKDGRDMQENIKYFNQNVVPDAIQSSFNYNKKIHSIDHHDCHSHYAVYGHTIDKNRLHNALVVTADASGDFYNWSISIIDNGGEIKRLDRGKDNHIARIYKYVTLILGMKPNEHEYKVMGLSSYSKSSKHIRETEKIFFDILNFEDGKFFSEKPTVDSYFDIRDRLEGHRFDNIAAALQSWSTNIVVKWIEYWMIKTKKNCVCYSGGLSMNIKTNGELLKIKNLDWLSVPASGGDESLSAGACFSRAIELGISITPMKHVYLGGQPTCGSWTSRLNETSMDINDFSVLDNVNSKKVAMLLAKGYVIARCVGRSEFGARSLGNRSILADPSNIDNVKEINDVIKNRDFWMPFTPSILSEYVNNYLFNPKNITSPFMTIGFDSLPKKRNEIIGGLHAGDYSARPQHVLRETNPSYWELIDEFRKITGIPALLNTSLNLHGEPMNYSLADSARTVALSNLNLLVMPNNQLLCKNSEKGEVLKVIRLVK